MCLGDLVRDRMDSSALAGLVDKNYCRGCTPWGFPYGEAGSHCSACGVPLEVSAEHIAATRVVRNRHAMTQMGINPS